MIPPNKLRQEFHQIRAVSKHLCAPLAIDDYQIQSIAETSPPKWHLAHVTWFFETFLLIPYLPDYQIFHSRFDYLFNSYYETIGRFHARNQRGLLSRPTVEEIFQYRQYVDAAMNQLFDQMERHPDQKILFFIELGLNHEQQHQELMCMDIKHNFSVNPLFPVYRNDLTRKSSDTLNPIDWHHQEAGLYFLGHAGEDFSYDNEYPRHQQYLRAFGLANRLISNAEFLNFIEDDGYQRADLWLADGWHMIQQRQWLAPLYWQPDGMHWQQFTLSGLLPLNLNEPVCHISYYEADAYARWAKKRLPSEAELEIVLSQQPIQGNFFDQDCLHPTFTNGDDQWFGNLWNWTCSSYSPYPGFKPLAGSAGEYNGKFMCNQMVLRGGSCVTSQNHIRASYRNFFYPQDRWQFSGIRLAEDL